MITCFLKYNIDPYRIAEFENYGKVWIDLVNKSGGTHHGYLLPFEGANNVAYASFSFPSLAEYEEYRKEFDTNPEFKKVMKDAFDKKFIVSYERSFMRPVFDGINDRARIE
ncbi:MAG: NIPSNAP family protein [Cyclobacteriaceae bacterium]